MDRPLLTVILPVQNAEATLGAAIQSVLCQTYGDFEVWVLENGSSDHTAEVARTFSDPRVKVFELGPVGFQGALAYGLEHARTEWLARMDADDLSFPERFERQVEVIEQQPDLVLVGTQRAYLTPFGHIFKPAEKIRSREVNRLSLRLKGRDHKFFIDASVIFRRRLAINVGGYDDEFQMGDVPLWFRMLSRGKGWEIARPLYLRRLDPSSMGPSQTSVSDQPYRLLVKYVPELLHLYPEEASQEIIDETIFQKKLWKRIADLELMAGDRHAVLQALNYLDQDERFAKKARRIKSDVSLGWMGNFYHNWRNRHNYQHRPDWEKMFTAMVGSLTLAREAYASIE